MGKSLPSTTRLQEFARIVLPDKLQRAKEVKPASRNRLFVKETARACRVRVDSARAKQGMESRAPLALVVSDCVKRWFEDTLKEDKAGDSAMQLLVGQMYCSGYGVPIDAQKGRAWINRASKSRSSVWKVSDKRPGYNASESDSDELKGDSN